MRYKLYYQYLGIREKLPPTIDIHYDFQSKGLEYYTFIDEEMATYLKLKYSALPYIISDHEV